MRTCLAAAVLALLTALPCAADTFSSFAEAQVEMPLPTPVVSYYAPAATTAYYAPTTTYYAPAGRSYGVTTSYYAPTTSYYAPSTSYYAPTTTYYAPAPTVVYRPAPVVAAPVYAAPVYSAPVFVGRPAVVTQRVYYPGQPLRNALRVLLP